MMNKAKAVKTLLQILIPLAAVLLIAQAWTDLDWMIVCYKYQFGQGLMGNTVWEFCPYLSMNWWLALQFTLTRFMAGCLMLGAWMYRGLRSANP